MILRNLQRVVLIPQVLVLWFWARKYRVKNFRVFVRDVRVILRSGLFLSQHYHGLSKDPKPSGGFFQQTNAISHFLVIGAKEEFDPNPLFSVRFYLNAYPDVRSHKSIHLFITYTTAAKRGGVRTRFSTARSINGRFRSISNHLLRRLEIS